MNIDLVTFVTVALATIAFGMGLGLKFDDFAALAKVPRATMAGIAGQIVFLPVIAGLIALLAPSPALAMGLILVGVCPGGSSSNYFSYLARGDVALSVSLTAISGSLAILTVPLVFNFIAGQVVGQTFAIELPVAKTMRDIALFMLAPLLAGMAIRSFKPELAQRVQSFVANAAFALLVGLTPFLIGQHFNLVMPVIWPSLALASTLLIATLLLGLGLSKLLGISPPQARSLSIEIGVQNVALAIFLALSYLDNPAYVIIPVTYLIMMYAILPIYIVVVRNNGIAD